MFEVQTSDIVGREFVKINERLSLIREVNPNMPADNAFTIMLDKLPIPNLELELSQNDAGQWYFTLDHRFGFIVTLTPDDLESVVRLVANAMAVAAGFSCFGVESRAINPYRKYPSPGEAVTE